MISVRELGTPAPMVKFLLDTPAALIESIPGKVHDVEGVHDRSRAGKFFDGGAFEPGESTHRDDLDALAPSVRLGGQPGFEDPLGAVRDHVQEPGGTATVSYGRHVQDDVNEFVALGGCSATREHTPGSGSGARSRARLWGVTRKARAPSA